MGYEVGGLNKKSNDSVLLAHTPPLPGVMGAIGALGGAGGGVTSTGGGVSGDMGVREEVAKCASKDI